MKEEWDKRENEVHQDDQMTLLDYVSEFINYQKYGWYLKQASDGYGDGGSGFVVEKERY